MPDNFNFMNDPSFGAPGGLSQNAQIQHTQAQTGLTQVETKLRQGQLAVQPQMLNAEMLGAMASARLHSAQAGLAETKSREGDILAKAMAGASTGASPGTSVANEIFSRAITAASMGGGSTAMELMKDALRMSELEQTVRHNDLAAKHQEMTNDRMKIDQAASMLWGATDQKSWLEAADDFERVFKEPASWRKTPFSEYAKQQNINRALTVKQQMDNELKQDAQIAREEASRAREKHAESTLELMRAKNEQARELAALKAKGGGKFVREPSKAEVELAKSIITKNFPDMKDPELSDAARSVASDAKTVRTNKPGLNPEQATYNAFRERKSDFATTTESHWFGKDTKKTEFSSRNTPLPMVSEDKREVEKYYEQGDKTYQWVEEGGRKGWREVN